MRFDSTQQLTAHKVVNTYTERQIADLIHQYGEERAARRIARAIVRERPVDTTTQLAEIVAGSVRKRRGGPGAGIHPATRTFQAIRMTVNKELDNLKSGPRSGGTDTRRSRTPGGHQLPLARGPYGQELPQAGIPALRLSADHADLRLQPHSPAEAGEQARHQAVRDRDLHQPSKPQRPSARGRKVISMMSHYSRNRRHGPVGSGPLGAHMQHSQLLTAIDIGSSKVSSILVRRNGPGDVQFLAHSTVPSRGMRKGNVTDAEATEEAVRESIENIQYASGERVVSAYVGVTGGHIEFENRWRPMPWIGGHRVVTAGDMSPRPGRGRRGGRR